MATTATLHHAPAQVRVATAPRSFTPPGDRRLRLSHLDPRPLWYEAAIADSPWRSPTFWLAYALVAPVAAIARLFGR